MVISTLFEGMGNQLFQYAIGRCLAKRRNTEFKLNATNFQEVRERHHAFYKLNNFNVKENFATAEEIQNATSVGEPPDLSGIFMPEVLDSPPNVILGGCWQNENYFAEIRDILLEEFTLKKPLGKNSAAWRDKILSANCAVSLHVRHGDYLTYGIRNKFGVLSPEYYFKCIEELQRDYPDITVFVFSDDMQWCKENLKFDVPTDFVEGCEHDFEEMHLMSLCKHNIISNSTFSWWGAWLNKNPDKKVFAPDTWFAFKPDMAVVPESWIKIPAAYNSWTPPMLSIIVYVENRSSTLPITLQSIFSQFWSDYEVIFVDASTDGSGQICRQAAVNPNVNLLKADSFADKFAAWNKGLDVARGDYVLFLSAKDFILPQTSNILCTVCDGLLFKYADNQRIYLTYSNISTYIPNIICSTQIFMENDGGDVGIHDLPDKRFFLNTDAAFQGLPNISEFTLPDKEKLIGLANKMVNNFVSTKFFKRKFLAENKITFKEKAGWGTDAELLFLVNAFFATDKIFFVPQVFSGRLK